MKECLKESKSYLDLTPQEFANSEKKLIVHQTNDEQLASFIIILLASSFKRNFISMLSSLSKLDWDIIEKIATLLKKED